jgi:hypothetical protein
MKNFSDSLVEEYLELSEHLLTEKWYTCKDDYSRLWFSDSISEFRSFLKNIPSTTLRGLRLCVSSGIYLAADASEFNHDMMIDAAKDLYLVTGNPFFEKLVCGCPTYAHFDSVNYGYVIEEDESIDEIKKCTENDYTGLLCADCGSVEILLYDYTSDKFPDYVHPWNKTASRLETSEIWKVIQPICKKLYIID